MINLFLKDGALVLLIYLSSNTISRPISVSVRLSKNRRPARLICLMIPLL